MNPDRDWNGDHPQPIDEEWESLYASEPPFGDHIPLDDSIPDEVET